MGKSGHSVISSVWTILGSTRGHVRFAYPYKQKFVFGLLLLVARRTLGIDCSNLFQGFSLDARNCCFLRNWRLS